MKISRRFLYHLWYFTRPRIYFRILLTLFSVRSLEKTTFFTFLSRPKTFRCAKRWWYVCAAYTSSHLPGKIRSRVSCRSTAASRMGWCSGGRWQRSTFNLRFLPKKPLHNAVGIHAALRGEGHSWTVAKSTQRPLPRPSSFIIANIYQIFLVYLSYYAPYRSVLINSVIVCYISTSQIKHSHYILGIIISISHFFSIVLRQGPPPHLHLKSLYEAQQTSATLLLK